MKSITRTKTEIFFKGKIAQSILLSLIVFFIWCWVYGRMSLPAWKTPISYGGDATLMFAFAKAFLDGDIVLVASKWVQHLGAPFVANWNDYPFTEDVIPALIGALAKIFGLFTAANIVLLLAHVLAALSFWFVGTELRYHAAFVWAGALLFAFSHFILTRGFTHIVLSYCWHLPLVLLVSWWCYSNIPISLTSRKLQIALLISFITGLLNPYYTWIYLQFIGFGLLMQLIKGNYKKAKSVVFLGIAAVVAFLIVNADTLIYSFQNGRNPEAVNRTLSDLELYGLKIPELIFPPAHHAWKSWAEYGQNHYFLKTLIKGEFWSPYLGLVAIAGLAFLFLITIHRVLSNKTSLISVHAWQTLWVIVFSLIGGLNLLVGTFGLILFRASNRYSVVILAIVLLFVVRQLSRSCPNRLQIPLAIFLTTFGLWDQIPARQTAEQVAQMAAAVQVDRSFSESLESRVVPGAMIFELPVMPFPEHPPIYGMGDYENFRPYLYTSSLRYSYGTDKGRGDAEWQERIAKMSPNRMVSELEHYGFSAVIVNRKGFEDKGNKLIGELSRLQGSPLVVSPELVAFQLQPSFSTVVPALAPSFDSKWYSDELSHRWASASEAKIRIVNADAVSKQIELQFSLITIRPRSVQIFWNGQVLEESYLDTSHNTKSFIFKTTLRPGTNILQFKTDVPAAFPENGDLRKISFGIVAINFNVID